MAGMNKTGLTLVKSTQEIKRMKDPINKLDLIYEGKPASFIIKTMEEIDRQQGGIADHPHRHNYYTIIHSYTATGKHIIDFREYSLAADQLFFVSPDQVHQVIADPSPEGVVILFTPEFLVKNGIQEDFISNIRLFRSCTETPPLPVEEPMKTRLINFTDEMLEAFRSDSSMRMETIGAYLKLFLIECNTHCSLNPFVNTQKIEVEKSMVKSFKDLVESHFHAWHQVQDYASALNVTPGYLNDVIKESLHLSAKDYIQSRLILEAKRISLYTKKSGKEIGYDLGFEDPSHFNKFFKLQTGQSLAEFKSSL
jgi:AraC family transcriptional regulator, transcriptional activator of pobA